MITWLRAADGIFIDYHWAPTAPEACLAAAGSERSNRVFVGVDVWGRGTPFGGQWTCAPAVEAIVHRGVSLALFAPAWTYEAQNGRFDTRAQYLMDKRCVVAWLGTI